MIIQFVLAKNTELTLAREPNKGGIMSNAYFTIKRPENDAFRGYLPGSRERAE